MTLTPPILCGRARCATFCGPTPTTVVAGVSPLGGLATPSGRISARPSITPTVWRWCHVLISWSWRATTGVTIVMLSPSSPPPTTATAVATRPPSWNSMTHSNIHCEYPYHTHLCSSNFYRSTGVPAPANPSCFFQPRPRLLHHA